VLAVERIECRAEVPVESSSSSSSGLSCWEANVENAPPGMCLTPIRRSPEVADEQIE